MVDAHQLEIHQHLIHLRVADAFADPERGGVDTIGAGDQRRHRVRDRQVRDRSARASRRESFRRKV